MLGRKIAIALGFHALNLTGATNAHAQVAAPPPTRTIEVTAQPRLLELRSIMPGKLASAAAAGSRLEKGDIAAAYSAESVAAQLDPLRRAVTEIASILVDSGYYDRGFDDEPLLLPRPLLKGTGQPAVRPEDLPRIPSRHGASMPGSSPFLLEGGRLRNSASRIMLPNPIYCDDVQHYWEAVEASKSWTFQDEVFATRVQSWLVEGRTAVATASYPQGRTSGLVPLIAVHIKTSCVTLESIRKGREDAIVQMGRAPFMAPEAYGASSPSARRKAVDDRTRADFVRLGLDGARLDAMAAWHQEIENVLIAAGILRLTSANYDIVNPELIPVVTRAVIERHMPLDAGLVVSEPEDGDPVGRVARPVLSLAFREMTTPAGREYRLKMDQARLDYDVAIANARLYAMGSSEAFGRYLASRGIALAEQNAAVETIAFSAADLANGVIAAHRQMEATLAGGRLLAPEPLIVQAVGAATDTEIAAGTLIARTRSLTRFVLVPSLGKDADLPDGALVKLSIAPSDAGATPRERSMAWLADAGLHALRSATVEADEQSGLAIAIAMVDHWVAIPSVGARGLTKMELATTLRAAGVQVDDTGKIDVGASFEPGVRLKVVVQVATR